MTRYVYDHGTGLGEMAAEPGAVPLSARLADPGDTGGPTMADVDLLPGTVVGLDPRDDERDLEIITWTDAVGTPRRTSVDPGFFAGHFREVE
jgi:hypothetical protein